MTERDKKQIDILRKVLNAKTENIDLGKKYEKQINLKLSVIKESKNIEEQKSNYTKWYNSYRNTPNLSPNYKNVI